VKVENQGSDYESFTVTVYYDSTAIASQNVVNLLPNWDTTLTYYWDTTGMARGNYTIKAVASTVPGETDTLDNVLIDGKVKVLWHDVAVASVVTDRTWVYQGHNATINVTVVNQGDFAETITVTLYYNVTANLQAGTQIINLLPGESQTLTFVWTTKGVQYCHNYTMTAVASIAPTDNNPPDNTFADGKIKVRILGDVDGNGVVNMLDLYLVSRNFGLREGDLGWNPDLDLNLDRLVNMVDMYLTAANFGKVCP
jgi:hypothetical protein